MRFYDKHVDWLSKTAVLYNRVVKHYYELLAQRTDLLSMSNFYLMRELEILSVGTREMKKAGEKAAFSLVDFPVIPLYFRRAAINCAISMMRSFQARKITGASMAEKFSAAPVYYKGMYKELKEGSVLLKVFTGEKWKWQQYRFCGRKIPKESVILSPAVYMGEEQAYLHIPVQKTVEDIRTVAERMKTEDKIFALAFPGGDSIAVGALISRTGEFLKASFFRGGLELKAKRKRLIRKWKKGEKKYLKKIENVNTYYAHLISRQILDFCKREGVTVIVVPNYRQAIDFSNKGYLKTDNFEWIGRRVIRYLKYKGFSEGILVSKVPVYGISNSCSVCGEKIRRYNDGHTPGRNYYGGQLFICSNGHRGNSGLNTARNIGKRFLSYF